MSRQKFLATYTDIGTSHAIVKELQQYHEQFQLDCMVMFKNYTRSGKWQARCLGGTVSFCDSFCDAPPWQKNA